MRVAVLRIREEVGEDRAAGLVVVDAGALDRLQAGFVLALARTAALETRIAGRGAVVRQLFFNRAAAIEKCLARIGREEPQQLQLGEPPRARDVDQVFRRADVRSEER